MSSQKHTDLTLTAVATLSPGTYEARSFENCMFDNLSSMVFTDCAFLDCNLSSAKLLLVTVSIPPETKSKKLVFHGQA